MTMCLSGAFSVKAPNGAASGRVGVYLLIAAHGTEFT